MIYVSTALSNESITQRWMKSTQSSLALLFACAHHCCITCCLPASWWGWPLEGQTGSKLEKFWWWWCNGLQVDWESSRLITLQNELFSEDFTFVSSKLALSFASECLEQVSFSATKTSLIARPQCREVCAHKVFFVAEILILFSQHCRLLLPWQALTSHFNLKKFALRTSQLDWQNPKSGFFEVVKKFKIEVDA